jgi:hypothetical protein
MHKLNEHYENNFSLIISSPFEEFEAKEKAKRD